mmetsp:Transcript_8041/g.12415  ORF Transcript_8041/g.12415 Transcript_8041/m.12415 type:complete len:278 (-) Transcript_8041:866-1699(-)
MTTATRKRVQGIDTARKSNIRTVFSPTITGSHTRRTTTVPTVVIKFQCVEIVVTNAVSHRWFFTQESFRSIRTMTRGILSTNIVVLAHVGFVVTIHTREDGWGQSSELLDLVERYFLCNGVPSESHGCASFASFIGDRYGKAHVMNLGDGSSIETFSKQIRNVAVRTIDILGIHHDPAQASEQNCFVVERIEVDGMMIGLNTRDQLEFILLFVVHDHVGTNRINVIVAKDSHVTRITDANLLKAALFASPKMSAVGIRVTNLVQTVVCHLGKVILIH